MSQLETTTETASETAEEGQILPFQGENSGQVEETTAENTSWPTGEQKLTPHTFTVDVRLPDDNEPLRLSYSKATDSPEALAEYDQETRVEEYRLMQALDEAIIREEETKKAANSAKNGRIDAEQELHGYIRERRDGRGKPQQPQLFDGSQTAEREMHAEGLTDSPDKDLPPDEWTPKLATEEREDETWKLVTLREMVERDGLPAKVAEILETNGLDTLGKVTNFTAPSASGWIASLTDFKGFGPKKVEQWQDACENFWKRWPNELRTRSQNSGTSNKGDGGEPSSDRGSDGDEDEASGNEIEGDSEE